MQFSRDHDWYQVIRITGPEHNLLGVKLTTSAYVDPIIEPLLIGTGKVLVSAEEVKQQVLDGIADANERLGTNYHVSAIRFVASDTPSSVTYRRLASILVERIESAEGI